MRTVILHNGYNFDTIVMQRHGITLAPEQEEDTMIASHAFASHLPKRLDHVVSVYLDSAPWKIQFGRRGAEEKGQAPHRMEPSELCRYNSADARLSILAWKEMQPDLEDERKIYEHDKQLSVICRQMQIDGIAFDVARRKEIGREMHVLAADLKGKMRRLLHAPDFAPSKHGDVRWALFDKLGAPTFKATATGLASTSSATLESLRGETRAGRLAELILRYRKVTKIKSTYLDAIDSRLLPHGKRRSDLGKSDGTALGSRHVRAHYNWRPYGTVSGRWSCRFQSVPKWKPTIEDRPREVYVAAPGCELIYFDLSQSEMRAAAFLSGDENFIATCRQDVHSGNAKILFPAAAAKGWLEGGPDCELCKKEIEHTTGCTCPKGNPDMGKPFRDIAKNAGFGILYSAEIDTIYQFLFAKGFTVSVNQVRAMFDLVHRTYAR